MMDYEVFKDIVAEKFLSCMPEKYQDMDIKVTLVEKVNGKQDGLSLCRTDGEKRAFPTIFINDIYQYYLRSGNLQEVLENAAKSMVELILQQPEIPPLNRCTAKDSIIFQLVNTMQNENLLCRLPHREFQDLSIIYRWMIKADEKEMSSVIINNDMAEKLGMSEDQLFKAAIENTRRILPPVVKSMNEVMRDIYVQDGMPPEMAELMIGILSPKNSMWIITNKYEIDGATSMLYEDKLHELAEIAESDLYILPSSIHEVIVASAKGRAAEELAQTVAEINMDQVGLGERLSNQVYHYDRNLRKITLATDTPNKKLDEIAAEQKTVYERKESR